MPFKQPSVPELPDKICIGHLTAVGPSKVTQGGYNLIKIKIAAAQAGVNTEYNFMYRPGWLVEGFDPDTLGVGEMFVYSKNISSDRTPALRAFCGSDEKADERYLLLSDELISLPDPKETDVVERFLANRLLNFAENAEAQFGYVMSQRKDRETGELTRFYDLNYFFPATQKEVERWVKKAQQDPSSVILTFEV